MDPYIIEEKPHIGKNITIAVLAIILSLAIVYFFVVYNFKNEEKVPIPSAVQDNAVEKVDPKEELIKKESLGELSKYSSDNPVSTSTKEKLLKELINLNTKK